MGRKKTKIVIEPAAEETHEFDPSLPRNLQLISRIAKTKPLEGLKTEVLTKEEEASLLQVQEKKKAKKVIPRWMKDRKLIDEDFNEEVDTLESILHPIIIQNLKAMGCPNLFPVQGAVIPAILGSMAFPTDFSVVAPTGSGKTLAYAIPMAQILMERVLPVLRVLVMVPTRELLTQTKAVFDQVLFGTDIGIYDIGHIHLVEAYQANKIELLIATPGKLGELLEEGKISLNTLRYLVIDEADLLLQKKHNLFQNWLEKVLHAAHASPPSDGDVLRNVHLSREIVPRRHDPSHSPLIKLLFSATVTFNPQNLAALHFNSPQFFAPPKEQTLPPNLNHHYMLCKKEEKPMALAQFLKGLNATLCFTNSVRNNHRLYICLKFLLGDVVAEISGATTRLQRDVIIDQLASGHLKAVICTDMMSRGVDLGFIDTVIHYDTPSSVKQYIHRCGRTGRAGRVGFAYSLVTRGEKEILFSKLNQLGLDETITEVKGTRAFRFDEKMKANLELYYKYIELEDMEKNRGKNLEAEKSMLLFQAHNEYKKMSTKSVVEPPEFNPTYRPLPKIRNQAHGQEKVVENVVDPNAEPDPFAGMSKNEKKREKKRLRKMEEERNEKEKRRKVHEDARRRREQEAEEAYNHRFEHDEYEEEYYEE